MSVGTELNNIQYTGNNSTSIAYCVPFYFFENDDLKVVVTDQNGQDTTLQISSDYTVTGAGQTRGGNLTTTAPWPSTFKVTIYREIEATQTTVYEENANFPAKTEERALDKLTMLVQQLARKLSHTFRVRETDRPLTEATKVADSLLGLGADGAPVFRTADEVASFLNLSQQFFDRPTKTFLNTAERALAVPEFVGQIGSQRDSSSLWIATGISAGNWTPYSPSPGGVSLSMLADGILANSTAGRSKMAAGYLSANTAGRAKMADAYLTLAKIAPGIFTADAEGREKFANGFVNPSLTQAGLWSAIAPVGAVLQTVYSGYTDHTPLTALISPSPSSPPSSAAGTPIVSATITPSNASNKILVEWSWMGSPNADSTMVWTFSQDALSEVFFTSQASESANRARSASSYTILTAGTTDPTTIKVRMGPATAATWWLNGSAAGVAFGGTSKCTLKLSEIKA